MSDLKLRGTAVTKRLPKGHAFQISDLVLAQSWAAFRNLAMQVRLDHGSDDEEYEEVLEFRAATGARAHFIIWNDGDAVFVQPMPGRMQKHACLADALEHLSLRKPPALTDITPAGWPIR
ncbi:hypothetical protein [Rhodopila globiformis]|uniref:Uncharacterized protein n=1 Tax=Rhodopila globiformis TaxID=1071 RepID=A0A2S6NMG1_RHOGL|nr:hypothetical protein [Rhodopila globiformis]PPQ37108.1 hypothetical protein CCS01_03830 [Rhodopila globiformis]